MSIDIKDLVSVDEELSNLKKHVEEYKVKAVNTLAKYVGLANGKEWQKLEYNEFRKRCLDEAIKLLG